MSGVSRSFITGLMGFFGAMNQVNGLPSFLDRPAYRAGTYARRSRIGAKRVRSHNRGRPGAKLAKLAANGLIGISRIR